MKVNKKPDGEMRSDHLPERKGHEKGKRKFGWTVIGLDSITKIIIMIIVLVIKGCNNADERVNDNLKI